MNYKIKCKRCGVTSYYKEKPDIKTRQPDGDKIYELENDLKQLNKTLESQKEWMKEHEKYKNECTFYFNKYANSNFAKEQQCSFGSYLSEKFSTFYKKVINKMDNMFFNTIQHPNTDVYYEVAIRKYLKNQDNIAEIVAIQTNIKKVSQKLKEAEKTKKYIICPVCKEKINKRARV